MSNCFPDTKYHSFGSVDICLKVGEILIGNIELFSYKRTLKPLPPYLNNPNPRKFKTREYETTGSLKFCYIYTENLKKIASDKLPLSSVFMSTANEYGYVATMSVTDVRLLDEHGMSLFLSDLNTTNMFRFDRGTVNPWVPSNLQKDNHEAETYNAYSERWSFL